MSKQNNIKIDNVIAKDLCALSIEIGREFDIDITKVIAIMDGYFVKNYDKDLKIASVFEAIKNFKNPTLKSQTKLIKKTVKNSKTEKEKTPEPKKSICMYKDPRKGTECSIVPKHNQLFCAKHATTKFASKYMASLPDPDYKIPKHPPLIVRNKELKVWIVENTDLIVESPNKRIVIGYLNKNKITNKLTVKNKKLATDLGLVIK